MDQEGDTIEILVQSRRDRRAAKRFFQKLLKGQGQGQNRLVTDKLGSYGVAHREIMSGVEHDTRRWSNNRAEVSHEAVRRREQQMKRFKSPGQTQNFLSIHGVVGNLFRVGRQKVRAANYRHLRNRSFEIWQQVTMVA